MKPLLKENQVIYRRKGLVMVPRYIEKPYWSDYRNGWMYPIMCLNTGLGVWYSATEKEVLETYLLEKEDW